MVHFARTHRRHPVSTALLTGAIVLLAVWLLWGTIRGARGARRAHLVAGLNATSVAQRQRAAWAVIEHPDPLLIAELEQRVFGNEREPDAREACVYALGCIAAPSSLPALTHAAQLDEHGGVRAAAWLALARLDATQFQQLAQSAPTDGDPWERLGIAQGRLWLFDPTGIDALLDAVAHGDHAQRMIATRALRRSVAPLLDAVGRCPANLLGPSDAPLNADLVAHLRERCAEQDLQPIAAALQRLEPSTRALRREVGRLARARGHAAELLFGE